MRRCTCTRPRRSRSVASICLSACQHFVFCRTFRCCMPHCFRLAGGIKMVRSYFKLPHRAHAQQKNRERNGSNKRAIDWPEHGVPPCRSPLGSTGQIVPCLHGSEGQKRPASMKAVQRVRKDKAELRKTFRPSIGT